MPHRTTLTLDDDVADRLAREVHRTGETHRAVVNAALRRGLEVPPQIEPFTVRSSSMGRRPEYDIDNIEELLERLDGPARR